MPRKNFEDIGQLQGWEYLNGVITGDPDSDTDLCTVTIDGVAHADTPIYYHCDLGAEERDNGAIVGGATGFADGDSVFVLSQRSAAVEEEESPGLFVIAHADGIQTCGHPGAALLQLWDPDEEEMQYIFIYPYDGTVFPIKDVDDSDVSQPFFLSDLVAPSLDVLELRNFFIAANAVSSSANLIYKYDEYDVQHSPGKYFWPEYPIKAVGFYDTEWFDLGYLEKNLGGDYWFNPWGAHNGYVNGWLNPVFKFEPLVLTEEYWDNPRTILGWYTVKGSQYDITLYRHPMLSEPEDARDNPEIVWENAPIFIFPQIWTYFTGWYGHWGRNMLKMWVSDTVSLFQDAYSAWESIDQSTPDTSLANTKCMLYYQEKGSGSKFNTDNFQQLLSEESLYGLFGTTKAAHIATQDTYNYCIPQEMDDFRFDRFGVRVSRFYIGISNALTRLAALVNAERLDVGLSSLTINTALTSAAQGHADWMAENKTVSHIGAGGLNYSTRIWVAKYPTGSSSYSLGENVAGGYPTAAAVMEVWMASTEGHKENILSAVFVDIGLGVAYDDEGAAYWVQDFGWRDPPFSYS